MPRTRLSKATLAHVGAFVQSLGEGCAKPSQKFLRGMMLGLAMSGSVKLSEAARKLHGLRAITFHALHKGLCRGLKSGGWSALPMQERYLQEIRPVIPSNALVAFDLGDITKPRARKMPGLRTVRDGSDGGLKKGWLLVEVEAIFGKAGTHVPLWLELFSVGRRGYKSQRAMTQMAISTIVRHLGKLGLWVFDRGFSSWEFFEFLGKLGLKFLVRSEGNRLVRDLSDGAERSLTDMTRRLGTCASFVWGRRRTRRGYLIRVGFGALLIPQSGQMLWAIVARGFGRKPMLLLTSEPIADGSQAVRMVRDYLKRWGVEEAGRFVKQAFGLEDLRVLTWAGLVKLVWLVLWTYGLLCLIRLRAQKVYRQLLESYPSFGSHPRYSYYRVAAALSYVLLVGALSDPTLLAEAWKSG